MFLMLGFYLFIHAEKQRSIYKEQSSRCIAKIIPALKISRDSGKKKDYQHLRQYNTTNNKCILDT